MTEITCPFCLKSDVRLGANVCSECGASITYHEKGKGLVGSAVSGGLSFGLIAGIIYLFFIHEGTDTRDAILDSFWVSLVCGILLILPVYLIMRKEDQVKEGDSPFTITFSRGGSQHSLQQSGMGLFIPID